MEKIYKEYGSGILLVGIQNPFTTAKLISTNLNVIGVKSKVFKDIYFYDTSGSTFYKADS